jgi:hypothetical protein
VAGSLCRYITRPALSDERIQVNAAGQVQLELKTPWQDGTTHLVLSPLEFMQRLAFSWQGSLGPQQPISVAVPQRAISVTVSIRKWSRV